MPKAVFTRAWSLVPRQTICVARSQTGKSRIVSHTSLQRLATVILVRAGTVHSLREVVVFEVQENSDVTFRLYDWHHVDAETGQPRALQVDQAMACIDFAQGAVRPVVTTVEGVKPVLRELLFLCEHLGLWRIRGESPFIVGVAGTPRVLVCLVGDGQLEHDGGNYAVGKGDVLLLPAVVGACLCRPRGAISLLEVSLPEGT